MRDSKNILHAKLGVSPMERQYGGGLDAAYMNRRRSSAFAAPDATSAFASPMSKDGLPTIYREQGGPLPITSVYGQGIPRIIYRENGGSFMDDVDAQAYADVYGPADPGNVDPNEGLYDSTPELAFGAGQYVPPQRGDPSLPFNAPPEGSYVNPSPTPFRSTNPNYLRYEAQQKMNREIQSPEKGIGGRTPQEMTAGAGMPQLAYPSQDIINADINSMKRAAQNKLNEERKEKANKPDQTSATSLYLYNVAQHGKTFGGANLPPSALYKAAETPKGAMNLLSAIVRGDYGNRAMNLEVPQELIDIASQGRANQLNRKTGGGLPTIYRDVGGTADPGQDGDFNTTDEEDSYSDEGIGYNFNDSDTSFDPYPSVDPGLAQGLSGVAPSAPSAPSDSDDPSNYVTDKRYAELYGRSGDGRPSFTESGEFIYGRPGGEKGPTQQDYINRLNKDWPSWATPYYNALKDRGMTNQDATAMLAAAMATPGGLSGMQSAYESGYSYGGPLGTMQNLLERGIVDQLGLGQIIKADEATKKEDRELDLIDNPDLPEGVLDSIGLGGIYDSLKDIFSIQSDVSPRTLMSIENSLKGTGATFTPVNSFLAGAMDFALPAALKGLANLTGGGKTIGTITKNGMSFNLSDKGKLSMNMPTQEVDYGNDPKKVKKSKPQKKKAEEEKKKKSYMKDYFASLGSKEGEGGLSDLKNYYETQALKYVYPDKSDEEINIMINKP
jgi:hypothetical protein